MATENIHPIFDRILSRTDKEQYLNQKGRVIWLTGLSGSGKSTIAEALEKKLFAEGYFVQLLDGDNIRMGICNNLGFTVEDRKENIRRIAEVSKLFKEAGIICLNSFVSPTEEIRASAKNIIGSEDFISVYINTPLEICEARDVKGLYKKARAGEIKGFTGIDSPFEAPVDPDVEILTADLSVEQACDQLYNSIIEKIKRDN